MLGLGGPSLCCHFLRKVKSDEGDLISFIEVINTRQCLMGTLYKCQYHDLYGHYYQVLRPKG